MSIQLNSAIIQLVDGQSFSLPTLPSDLQNVDGIALLSIPAEVSIMATNKADGSTHAVAVGEVLDASQYDYAATLQTGVASAILIYSVSVGGSVGDGGNVLPSVITLLAPVVTPVVAPTLPSDSFVVAVEDLGADFVFDHTAQKIGINRDLIPVYDEANKKWVITRPDGTKFYVDAVPTQSGGDIHTTGGVLDLATMEIVLTANDGTEERIPVKDLKRVAISNVGASVTLTGDGTDENPLMANINIKQDADNMV